MALLLQDLLESHKLIYILVFAGPLCQVIKYAWLARLLSLITYLGLPIEMERPFVAHLKCVLAALLATYAAQAIESAQLIRKLSASKKLSPLSPSKYA